MSESILPYADTEAGASSGWSGSDTSAERAHRQDADGTTSRRQRETLRLFAAVGSRGLTWSELADVSGWHHGQASGTLSVLHKAGRIERLAERRGKSAIYVLPEFVGERDTRPQGRKPKGIAVPPAVRVSAVVLDNWLEVHDRSGEAISHFAVIRAFIEELEAAEE